MSAQNFFLINATSSTADATSYASGSFTPTNGRTAFVFACANRAAGEPTTPTLSGQSQTWTAVGNVYLAPLKITLFRATISGASAGTVTADYAGQTQLAHAMHYIEATSVDASPVVQSKTATAAANTTITATFDAAPTYPWNAILACFANDLTTGSIAVTNATNGWSALGTSSNSDGIRLNTVFRPDIASAVTATSGSANLLAFAVEVAFDDAFTIPTGAYSLSGTVTSGGSPIQNATVRVIDRTRGLMSTATTDVNGDWSVSVDSNTASQFAAMAEYDNGGTKYQALAPWAITAA